VNQLLQLRDQPLLLFMLLLRSSQLRTTALTAFLLMIVVARLVH